MGWLKDDVALITGGGTGLGLALVHRFINEGASVVVLERDANRADSLKREFGDQIETVVGDVTSYEDNVKAVETAVERFGRLDTFVANAGVFDFFKPLSEFEGPEISAAFDELLSINVKGGLLGARAALDALIKSKGSMIFTVSNAGFYTGGGGPLYTASKHGLVGVVRQLAHELGPKIRVNGVAPGGMRTSLSGLKATNTADESLETMEGFEELIIGITPLRMSPTPDQYCGPYVLLASRENAAPMTGVVINTDGGLGVRGIMNVCGGEDLSA